MLRSRAPMLVFLCVCGFAALAGCTRTLGAPPGDPYLAESNTEAMEDEEEEDALHDADL